MKQKLVWVLLVVGTYSYAADSPSCWFLLADPELTETELLEQMAWLRQQHVSDVPPLPQTPERQTLDFFTFNIDGHVLRTGPVQQSVAQPVNHVPVAEPRSALLRLDDRLEPADNQMVPAWSEHPVQLSRPSIYPYLPPRFVQQATQAVAAARPHIAPVADSMLLQRRKEKQRQKDRERYAKRQEARRAQLAALAAARHAQQQFMPIGGLPVDGEQQISQASGHPVVVPIARPLVTCPHCKTPFSYHKCLQRHLGQTGEDHLTCSVILRQRTEAAAKKKS